MKIEVSNGEIVDKLTILLIKQQNIKNQSKLSNIEKEINAITCDYIINKDSELFKRLYELNKSLWNIEDAIRLKESKQEFDQEFIELARSVYKMNDKRAEVKREINISSESFLIEEKSYEKY